MLKVKVNEGETEILAMGNVVELTADVSVVIRELYGKLENEKLKQFFIDSLKSFLDEGLYKMSGEEIAELNLKKIEEIKNKQKEEVEKKEQEKKDFANDVKTMIDLMKKVLEEK